MDKRTLRKSKHPRKKKKGTGSIKLNKNTLQIHISNVLLEYILL
jgi:hypothetical protein